MALNGFVDDSGSGEGKDRGNIFVLAGFVACPKQWEQFSHAWDKICDREPKTPDFKMQKAVRLRNEDGSLIWSEAQRNARIKQLVRLIKRKAQYRVETVMAWPNYDRVVKGRVPPDSTIHTFSAFTTSSCPLPPSWTRLISKEPLIGCSMIRVASAKMQINGTSLFSERRPSAPEQACNRPVFRHDKSVLPLKAADIYRGKSDATSTRNNRTELNTTTTS